MRALQPIYSITLGSTVDFDDSPISCISLCSLLSPHVCYWSDSVSAVHFYISRAFLYLKHICVFEAFLCLHSVSVSTVCFNVWSTFVYLMRICLFEVCLCIWGTFAYLKSVSVVAAHLPLSATVPYTIALLFSFKLICLLIYSQTYSMKLHSSLVNVLCIHILVIYKICQVVVYYIFHPCIFIQSADIRKQTSMQQNETWSLRSCCLLVEDERCCFSWQFDWTWLKS